MSLPEKVTEAGIKDANEAEEENDTAEEEEAEEDDDLDRYLDTLMLDMTMSIAKAKKGGDLVAIIA